MTETPTIGGLLGKANAQYRVFDMGRRVAKVARPLFAQVERGERPYPYPLQRQAWLGILSWDPKQAGQHFVWLLRFPLDEQGHLQYAARDEFLTTVLQSLGERQNNDGARIEQAHRESPYAFKPPEERLAAFHAQALVELRHPPSRFYAHAREYLSGRQGFDQWAFVGLQGLADLVARRDREGNAALLAEAIPRLPDPPLLALCQLLENGAVSDAVAAALLQRLLQRVDEPDGDPMVIAALLRSLGATQSGASRHRAVAAALDSPLGTHLDVLVAIAGRGWEALRDDELRLRYLECLARCDAGNDVFAQVVGDLLFIPGMRAALLESFRSDARSDELGRAIASIVSREP